MKVMQTLFRGAMRCHTGGEKNGTWLAGKLQDLNLLNVLETNLGATAAIFKTAAGFL